MARMAALALGAPLTLAERVLAELGNTVLAGNSHRQALARALRQTLREG